jgi:hypothetical protein
MKHLTTLLVLIISLCACTQTPTEETFVNPLFYEKIYPFSTYFTFKITPTSMTAVCLGNECTLRYTCEMLANNEYTVILKCSKLLPQTDNQDSSYAQPELFKFTLAVSEEKENYPYKLTVQLKNKELFPRVDTISSKFYYINITPDLERFVPPANVFIETDYSSGEASVNIRRTYE